MVFWLLLAGLAGDAWLDDNAQWNAAPSAVTVAGPAVRLGAPVPVTIEYEIESPRKVNGRSPKSLTVGGQKRRLTPGGAPATTQIVKGDVRDGRVLIEADYFVCEDQPDAICYRRLVHFALPVDEKTGSAGPLRLVTPPFR